MLRAKPIDLPRLKDPTRWLLTTLLLAAGLHHFIAPGIYVAILPGALPWPDGLVAIAGVAKIAGGLGLALPATRRLAAWGLVVLFIAVFPANINMAVHQLPLGALELSPAALWLRLPVQLVFIAWALWYTRPDAGPREVAHDAV